MFYSSIDPVDELLVTSVRSCYYFAVVSSSEATRVGYFIRLSPPTFPSFNIEEDP